MYLYIIFFFEAVLTTHQYVIKENSTHNTTCVCLNPINRPVNNICCLPCSPGETFVTNVGCTSCPSGTYKNYTSHDECTKCTKCNITIFQCTSISDTICENTTILTSDPFISKERFNSIIIIIVLIPIGIFFVLITIIVIYIIVCRINKSNDYNHQ